MSKQLTLSASALSTFRGCPKKFYWKYIERLERIGMEDRDSLIVGSSFHHLLETKGEGNLDGVPLPEKEKIMIEASAEAYLEMFSEDYENSQQEVKLDVEIGGNKYTGFIDLVVFDDEEGDTLIDYKFVRSVDFAETYKQGDQAHLYPLMYTMQTGRKVKAMKFVCVVKPTIRQKKTEDLAEYFARVKEWYKQDNKFKIVDIEISEEMEDEIILDLQFFQHMIDNDIYYMNTGNCMAYGSECEFKPLCYKYEDAMQDFQERRKRDA